MIKTLIVDDSIIYRSQIKLALNNIDNVEVIGVSSNGRLAIERLKLGGIDLVILDLEMPEMDGLSTLKEINTLGIDVKTIVFSSFSVKGAEQTITALNEGASDFVAKPSGENMGGNTPQEVIQSLLEKKVKSLFLVKAEPKVRERVSPKKHTPVHIELFKPRVIVIGSSTGGPRAIEEIFSKLRPPINCPILITQHMPPIFTKTFAERIEKVSGIESCEAKNNTLLKSNMIYVAPGDYHLSLEQRADGVYTKLDQGEKIHSVRPAVDYLFSSTSRIFKENCLGIVLTGMGCDGADGASKIKNNNGVVLIQDRDSCVVHGMPRAVEVMGNFDLCLNLSEITKFIKEKSRM